MGNACKMLETGFFPNLIIYIPQISPYTSVITKMGLSTLIG